MRNARLTAEAARTGGGAPRDFAIYWGGASGIGFGVGSGIGDGGRGFVEEPGMGAGGIGSGFCNA